MVVPSLFITVRVGDLDRERFVALTMLEPLPLLPTAALPELLPPLSVLPRRELPREPEAADTLPLCECGTTGLGERGDRGDRGE